MDREIGRVLDFLDERGLAGDTLVVYASDNGYLWGEHGLADKRWAYEPSSRIPLLVRWPGPDRQAGAVSTALVANVDVAPTILDAAGLGVPGWMQGRSLLPVLRDPAARVREALLYRYFFEAPYPTPTQRAIVTERYKYVEYEGLAPELFDLARDPDEATNLIAGDASAQGVAGALATRLESLEREVTR
jgi:N-acetylglucosamine-6-sulfatase